MEDPVEDVFTGCWVHGQGLPIVHLFTDNDNVCYCFTIKRFRLSSKELISQLLELYKQIYSVAFFSPLVSRKNATNIYIIINFIMQ